MNRLRSLDALRGIAALQVVIAHMLGIGQDWVSLTYPWVRFTPVRLIMEAHPAVVFFFVLSGFVLTLSILKEKRLGYGSFVVRRVCRIYLPFAAAVCVSALICFIIRPSYVAGTSELFAGNWTDYSPVTIARHFAMTGLAGDIELDGVMWSLVHEMRISLVIPALVALFTFSTSAGLVLTTALGLGGLIGAYQLGQTQFWVPNDLLNAAVLTVFYSFPFGIGIATALNRERLVGMVSRAPLYIASAILLGILLMQRLHIGTTGPSDFPVSVMAAALIVLTLSSPMMESILMVGPLQWLGRVSYSLYLIHLPVLLTMVHALGDILPLSGVVALSAPLVLIAAHLFNHFVEKQAARLGRTLAISR